MTCAPPKCAAFVGVFFVLAMITSRKGGSGQTLVLLHCWGPFGGRTARLGQQPIYLEQSINSLAQKNSLWDERRL